MPTGTLKAYWPDPGSIGGWVPISSSVNWEVNLENNGSSVYLYTYVQVDAGTSVSNTRGDVTFSTSGGSTNFYWRHLGNPQSSSMYIGDDEYYSSKRGKYIELQRRSSSYTVTVNVTFEVEARNNGRKFSDGTESDSASVTVTVPALPSYTISYNANGGSGAPSSQTKQYGSSISLSSSTPTRSGYTFNSWNTSSNGTGTSYSPGASYSSNSNLTLYAIWNPIITFSANGGTGAPNPVTKTFNSTATIPSTRPTKRGYIFVRWTTYSGGGGTSYLPGDTVPASMNTAMTLYAQYDTITAPPTISSLTVFRCDESGRSSDMGSYVKVTAYWSVDLTYDQYNTATVTGRYTGDNGVSTSFVLSPSSGTSGPSTAIVANIDTDRQYTFVVTVTDTNNDVGHTNVTTRNAILTRAKFIMDFRAGGNAMGIGSAAPQSGLMVGYKTTFNDEVTINGNVTCAPGSTWTAPSTSYQNNNSSHVISEVFEAADGITVDRVTFYACGPMRGVYINAYGSMAAGGWRTIGRILSNDLTSNYIPRYIQASFVWNGGIGVIQTSGYVQVYPFNDTSAVTVAARYF